MRFAMLNDPNSAVLITATTRLEAWQLSMQVGDHFLVVARDDVVLYGEVVEYDGKKGALPPRFCNARLYSEMYPQGDVDIVDLLLSDLPMSIQQWEAAKVLGWPRTIVAARAIMTMGRPASA